MAAPTFFAGRCACTKYSHGHYAFDGDSLPSIVYRVVNEAPVEASTLRPQLPAETGQPSVPC